MSVDISWHVPLRVIRAHIYGEVKPEQLLIFPAKARVYVESAIRPVHILLDDGEALPAGLSIRQLRSLLKFKVSDAEPVGWVVGVGEVSILGHIMLPLLFKTMGLQFKRVLTIDDAMAFLHQEDATLASYTSQPEEHA